MRIQFTVPAIPVAQPRQRVAVIAGHAHNYTPTQHPVNAFKAAVQMAFAEASGGELRIEGPVGLQLVFCMPRPKSMTWKTRLMPRVYRPGGRGDWDNLAKSVADALNGLAWRDDSQICLVHVEVFIAGGCEQPHVEVEIKEIQE